MPRGVRRDKSVRLNEELDRINESIQKATEVIREMQMRKKEVEKELELYEKSSIIEMVESSGLSADELKELLKKASKNHNEVAVSLI